MEKISNTKNRDQVAHFWKCSISLVTEGKAEEVKNWDSNSPWHNSKFRDLSTNVEWVVYLADQAWPGEVRILDNE